MSKTLSTTLYETFEKNRALKMRADHFLSVLLRAGVTISLGGSLKLVRFLGIDFESCVDVWTFSALFEGIEQEPRFSQGVLNSAAPRALEDIVEAPRLQFEDRTQFKGLSGEWIDGCEDVDEAGGHEDSVNIAEIGGRLRVASDGGDNEECPRTLSFSRQVTSDDGSEWTLDDEDKYTLPQRQHALHQRRRLNKHEALKACFITLMCKVKARFEASAVNCRPSIFMHRWMIRLCALYAMATTLSKLRFPPPLRF
eukprot:TRINITY_DN4888_c0_g3_i1.p1 TRINITY_DN4888_c0_g3~~TRINITY_DN4888_c0_g3_i1.p1  ORF type:complete len:254 (+),score=37.66 TRINITY_DN4888_c0_g3_i1:71-832(+)